MECQSVSICLCHNFDFSNHYRADCLIIYLYRRENSARWKVSFSLKWIMYFLILWINKSAEFNINSNGTVVLEPYKMRGNCLLQNEQILNILAWFNKQIILFLLLRKDLCDKILFLFKGMCNIAGKQAWIIINW